MATMTASQPSLYTSRPAYLDRIFHPDDTHHHQRRAYHSSSPSLRSNTSSVSSSTSTSTSPLDTRAIQPQPRTLSPAFEEDPSDDRISVRSLRLHLSPRHRLKNLLHHRRTYPQIQETAPALDADEMIEVGPPSRRRPSLPRLQTAFTSPLPQTSHSGRRGSKPLPAPPLPVPQELNCGRCYYFHARNCNGYVMGGAHGDACENCAAAGFFGAP